MRLQFFTKQITTTFTRNIKLKCFSPVCFVPSKSGWQLGLAPNPPPPLISPSLRVLWPTWFQAVSFIAITNLYGR